MKLRYALQFEDSGNDEVPRMSFGLFIIIARA